MPYRKLLFPVVFILILSGCPKPAFPPNVVVSPDIIYARAYVTTTRHSPAGGRRYELRELRVDVFAPDDRPGMAKPAVLMVHGGAFVGGSRQNEDLRAYAAQVAAAGYVCFLIDYRLEEDGPPAPDLWGNSAYSAAIHAAAVDGNAALRFIFAHLEEFEVDPDCVAVMGVSAGAITALNIGMGRPGSFADDGPGFVSDGNHAGQATSVRAVADLWGSAAFVLEDIDANDPPVLIVHGTLDRTPGVSYDEAVVLKRALKNRGIPFEFYPLHGKGHSPWDAEVDDRNLAEITVDFLDSYMTPPV